MIFLENSSKIVEIAGLLKFPKDSWKILGIFLAEISAIFWNIPGHCGIVFAKFAKFLENFSENGSKVIRKIRFFQEFQKIFEISCKILRKFLENGNQF